jgi:hypothetical protein
VDGDVTGQTPAPDGGVQPTHRFAAGEDGQQVEEITLPATSSDAVVLAAIAASIKVAISGMVIGAAVIIGGIVLILLGVAGSVSWQITGGGINAKLQTGVVGVVITVIGLLIIFFTRQKVDATAAPHTAPPKKKSNEKSTRK